MVGAGAVENSWAPVLRALQKHARTPITPDNANLFLTRIVYQMRFFTRFPDPPDSPYAVQDFSEKFRTIKQDITSELLAAEKSGELKLRNAMPFIIDKFIAPKADGFMFLTTNWDRVAERDTERLLNEIQPAVVKAFHIHGAVDEPDTLYLPSEEAYEIYRTDEQNNQLGGIHVGMMDALGSVKNLILYGLSLSPLDAELAQYLSSGLRSDVLENVTIVAPDYMTIADRLRMILRDPRVQISGVDPTGNPINQLGEQASASNGG